MWPKKRILKWQLFPHWWYTVYQEKPCYIRTNPSPSFSPLNSDVVMSLDVVFQIRACFPAQLLSTHVFYSLVLHVESSNVQATHEKDLKLSAGHSKCSLKNVWTYLHNIRTFLVCHLECYPHSNSGGDYGWFQTIIQEIYDITWYLNHGWSSS